MEGIEPAHSVRKAQSIPLSHRPQRVTYSKRRFYLLESTFRKPSKKLDSCVCSRKYQQRHVELSQRLNRYGSDPLPTFKPKPKPKP